MTKKIKSKSGFARDIFQAPSGQISNLIFQKNGRIRIKYKNPVVKRQKK